MEVGGGEGHLSRASAIFAFTIQDYTPEQRNFFIAAWMLQWLAIQVLLGVNLLAANYENAALMGVAATDQIYLLASIELK